MGRKRKYLERKNQMSKKGKPFNNLEVVTNCKEHFLDLCKQYEHMGKLFSLQSKAMSHPMFSPTSFPQIHDRIVEQYKEIGEELKNIGTYLDLMPGKKIMKKEGDTRTSQVEEKMKKTQKEKTFVSNIKPKEEKDDDAKMDMDLELPDEMKKMTDKPESLRGEG